MSEEAALLAAVRQDPDDDTPRLVYADWLQEHGDADRAEFIRLQCQATRLPAGDKERRKKEKAAESLFKSHKGEWFGPLWKKFHSTKPAVSHCHLERGFITSLKGRVREFVGLAAEIERHAPCLRRAVVLHTNERLGDLLAAPFVRRVGQLHLEGMSSNSITTLLEHPGWGEFEHLRLGVEFRSEADTLTGLAEAAVVKAAGRLDLKFGYHLPTEELQDALAAAQEPSVRELARLDLPRLRGLGFWGMQPDAATALAGWPGLTRLDWLDFETCLASDEAVAIVLGSPRLPPLARLNLNKNGISEVGAEAVSRCDRLGAVTDLPLEWNELNDAAAELLAASACLPSALNLDVSFNRLTERGLACLRARFGAGVVSEEQY